MMLRNVLCVGGERRGRRGKRKREEERMYCGYVLKIKFLSLRDTCR